MKTKTYKVNVFFTFTGEFEIKAESAQQAKEFAEQSCGMSIGEINSSLPYDDVDWEFDMAPEMRVGKVRKAKT